MTYVLSDIHGNMPNFKSILKQIDLQPEDTLYVLGDVIDRYPDGIRILRMIMAMPNAKMLLGNHEHMMLAALTKSGLEIQTARERSHSDHDLMLWYRNGGALTHNYLKYIRKSLRQEIFSYLENLPLNIDIEVNGIKYKLVHASPTENYDLYDNRSYYGSLAKFAVWERWNQCHPVPEGYILVFGHTPTSCFHKDNPLTIWYCDEAIGIDCGSGFPKTENAYLEKGRLACLRLDDMKEFYSDEM